MKRHCLNVHKMDEAQFQAMMDSKEGGGAGVKVEDAD